MQIKKLGRKFQINDGGRYLNFLSLQEAQQYIAGKGVAEKPASAVLLEAEAAHPMTVTPEEHEIHKDIVHKLKTKSGDDHLKNLGEPEHHYSRHTGEHTHSTTKSEVAPGKFKDLFHKITKTVHISKASPETREKTGITHHGHIEYNYEHPGGGSNGHEAGAFNRHEDGSVSVHKHVAKDYEPYGPGSHGTSWERKKVKTLKESLEEGFTAVEEDFIIEAEQLDEKLTKKEPPAEWIHDFVHSDNPKFAGKSKEERRKMALGAYYAKQNEEVNEAAKPDFLDLDKDGNKEESMKKAAKDKKEAEKRAKEHEYNNRVNTSSMHEDEKEGKEGHEDEKEDKALIKKMVKKDCIKEDDTFKSYEYEISESYESLLKATLSLAGYSNLAEASDAEKGLLIKQLEEAFDSQDYSIVLEDYVRQDVEDSIDAHKKAGHKVSDPKYTKKDGKMYAQYTLTTPEGDKKTITYHGAKKRMEHIAD